MTSTRFLLAALALGLFTLAGCDPGPVAGTDTPGTDAPVIDCENDEACDDGLFCNGEETCNEGVCAAGAVVVCDDGIACTVDACSETRRACEADVPDADGDGFGIIGCGDGTDCDDTDENRFPGNAELCNDVDEDCDLTTLGTTDFDADGFVSSACCNPGGSPECGPDCDDTRATTFPGALEVCDDLDQDCDGVEDNGVDLAGFEDHDLDGIGGETAARECAGTSFFATAGGDCDDENPLRYPGAPELCDLMENDCDGATDETPVFVLWYPDTDGDTFGTTDASLAVRSCAPVENASTRPTDCDDDDAAVHPAAAEACDGVDNNCNGLLDYRVMGRSNDWEDDDRDGVLDAACPGGVGTDCDDTNPVVGGGSPELCDGADNDCDATVDEGVLSTPYYRDVDGDGYGSVASGAVNACVQPPGFSVRGGDCADAVASRNPGATEVCNVADDDCDSAIDESCTSDCTAPGAVRCGGTCIDPRTDEDHCGASLSCTGSASGAACGIDELCAASECRSVFLSPNGDGLPWSPPDSTISYQIDYAEAPFDESFVRVYLTTDGTRPGVSPSTTVLSSVPANVILEDGDTLRWFIEIGGYRTPEQRYTHTRNAAGEHYAGLVPGATNVSVSGFAGGPAIAAHPGDIVTVNAPARMWRGDIPEGCPTCIWQYVVSVDGIGPVGCEDLGSSRPTYPGGTVGGAAYTFTAPSEPGIYPIRSSIAPFFDCPGALAGGAGGGLMIGWVVVIPEGPVKK